MNRFLIMIITALAVHSARAAPTTNCTSFGTLNGSTCTFAVNNTNDSGPGSLRQAIMNANAWGAYAGGVAGSSFVNITAPGTITLASALPMLFSNITINGVAAGTIISGNGQHRCLFASGLPLADDGTPQAIAVTLRNLTLQQCRARGGDGGKGFQNFENGGGGAGLGGGLFVNSNASVTLDSVSFVGNAAVGGDPGTLQPTSGIGGGGGMGGNGGDGETVVGVSGGGGLGGNAATAGGGIGASANGSTPGRFGSADGIGAISPLQSLSSASSGRLGLGGAGSVVGQSADAGFGGGAGTAPGPIPGVAGFGGGSSGNVYGPAAAGFGGGAGGTDSSSGSLPGLPGFGGGDSGTAGAGLGGALFVRSGGAVNWVGGNQITGNTVSGGAAGLNPAGDARGAAIFLQGGATMTLTGSSGYIGFDAEIADQTTQGTSAPAALVLNGPGYVTFGANNTYRGGTTIAGGAVIAKYPNSLGTGPVSHTGGTLLLPNGSGNVLQTGGYTQASPALLALGLHQPGCVFPDAIASSGPVSLAGDLNLNTDASCSPTAGQSFTLIRKDSAGPVSGTFRNAPGNVLIQNNTRYAIDYAGGDGNDVVVTVVVPRVLMLSAVSRATHAGKGDFDIDIYDFGSEPRLCPATNKIVVRFNQAVTSATGIFLMDVNGHPDRPLNYTISGDSIIVDMGSTDEGFGGVIFSDVNGAGAQSVNIAYAPGDANGSFRVNAADIAAIKAAIGKNVDASTFTRDLDCSGSIDEIDVNMAKARSGKTYF